MIGPEVCVDRTEKGIRMNENARTNGNMVVDVSTVLDCSAEKAWSEVQKSSLHLRVIKPLARIVPLPGSPWPARWEQGRMVQCSLYIFGVVPIGVHTIFLERIDHDRREIQSREHGALIKRWDHHISIQTCGAGRAIYRDRIEIEAGRLTVAIWAWANWFYRHRQRRWRALAKTL
jgi:hypothetical protein